MTTTQLVIGLVTILLGGGGLVAWMRAPSGIAQSNAEASKTTVDTIIIGMSELRLQVAELRTEVELQRGLYHACEEHRAEDRVAMAVMQRRIEELENGH